MRLSAWNPFTRKAWLERQGRLKREREDRQDAERVARELLEPPTPGPYRIHENHRLFGAGGLMLAVMDQTPAHRVVAFMRPADAVRFVETHKATSNTPGAEAAMADLYGTITPTCCQRFPEIGMDCTYQIGNEFIKGAWLDATYDKKSYECLGEADHEDYLLAVLLNYQGLIDEPNLIDRVADGL